MAGVSRRRVSDIARETGIRYDLSYSKMTPLADRKKSTLFRVLYNEAGKDKLLFEIRRMVGKTIKKKKTSEKRKTS
ncbi:hypothetical protein [Paenibacillus polymyxa]|uniref:hypothetical protein n=1 Tax=Paenibacillus polymyxa TaxID=1406 RepID=UPI001785C8FB|nr:hypothetical protein [Paenibacillus polymyxa]